VSDGNGAKTFRHHYLELQFDPDGVLGKKVNWSIEATIKEGYYLSLFPVKSFQGTAADALEDLGKILDRLYSDVARPFVQLTLRDLEDATNVHTITRDKDNTQWLRQRLQPSPKT